MIQIEEERRKKVSESIVKNQNAGGSLTANVKTAAPSQKKIALDKIDEIISAKILLHKTRPPQKLLKSHIAPKKNSKAASQNAKQAQVSKTPKEKKVCETKEINAEDKSSSSTKKAEITKPNTGPKEALNSKPKKNTKGKTIRIKHKKLKK